MARRFYDRNDLSITATSYRGCGRRCHQVISLATTSPMSLSSRNTPVASGRRLLRYFAMFARMLAMSCGAAGSISSFRIPKPRVYGSGRSCVWAKSFTGQTSGSRILEDGFNDDIFLGLSLRQRDDARYLPQCVGDGDTALAWAIFTLPFFHYRTFSLCS